MSEKKLQRADFMTGAQKYAFQAMVEAEGKFPRTHENCIKATGVARPGKTACDRYRRGRGGSDVATV